MDMTKRINRPEKQKTASTTGLLIGLMFGFLVGLGMFKSTPRSQRNSVFSYAIGLGVLFTTVIGYKIGLGTDEQDYRDDCLGINQINTQQLKQGESWSIESNWKEYDGLEHHLVTTMLEGELVSIYDGIVIIEHGYSNSRSAAKHHEEVKNDVIQRLKDGFKV